MGGPEKEQTPGRPGMTSIRGADSRYPLGMTNSLQLENGPVQIVSCPIFQIVIFDNYVSVYQRVNLRGLVDLVVHHPMLFVDMFHDFMHRILNAQHLLPQVYD